jgi:hypothetical protein
MAVAGLFFGRDAVESEVAEAMRGLLGDDTGPQAVQTMLAGASRPHEGLMAAFVGVSALLFAAIGVGNSRTRSTRSGKSRHRGRAACGSSCATGRQPTSPEGAAGAHVLKKPK